jgi:hypothetical protein
MSHYKANLRDIEFCLFDLLGRDKVMGIAPYGEVDRDTSMGMLEEMKRLCENDLAASFVEGDRVGAILNKGTRLRGVHCPTVRHRPLATHTIQARPGMEPAQQHLWSICAR